MKKIILSGIVIVSLLVAAGPVFAVKPTGNLAGAVNVPWNLSAAVMPVPPYGSGDILGSDTASKLIVNQPNGNTEVVMNGVMAGLNPNTTYTVYISNGYTPYADTGWNVTGIYTIALTVGSTPYTEYLVLKQNGNVIEGEYLALNLAGTLSRWVIESGTVSGNTITFLAHFDPAPTMHAEFTATIAADGSMINGTWHDVTPGTRSGNWSTTAGHATKTHTGNTGWTGMFNTMLPFTFTTDEFGAGSWHLNLRNENFTGLGEFSLSVWINEGGRTVLISDTFQVVVN